MILEPALLGNYNWRWRWYRLLQEMHRLWVRRTQRRVRFYSLDRFRGRRFRFELRRAR